MGERNQGTIQWGVGILCALIMAYMLYVSGGPERSYDIVAIVGMLALIAILLGHQDLLVRVLQVWRGNSPSPAPNGTSDGGGDKNRNGNGNGSNGERSEITQQILEDIRREQRERARQHVNPENDRNGGETGTGEEGR